MTVEETPAAEVTDEIIGATEAPVEAPVAPEPAPVATVETSTEPPPASANERKSRHQRKLDEIVANRQKRIAYEEDQARAIGLSPPDPTPVPLPEAAPEPPPKPEASEPPPPVSAPATPAPEPQGRVHRITLRGRQLEMPEADLIRAAEFGLESEARRLEQAQQQRQQPAPPPPAPRPEQPPALDRAALVELVRQIQFGEEEQAASALETLLKSQQQPQQPAVDPQQIAAEVYNRVSGAQSLERQIMTFAQEYDDIVSDDALSRLAADYLTRYRDYYAQMGQPKIELDLMREAGNAVRADIQRWRGQPSVAQPTLPPAQPAAPVPPAPAANGARVAIKRSTPQAPAASAAPPANEQGPRLVSGAGGSSTVAWIRQSRGQPAYR